MKSIGSSTIVVAFAACAALACSGKLEVGENTDANSGAGGTGGEGGSSRNTTGTTSGVGGTGGGGSQDASNLVTTGTVDTSGSGGTSSWVDEITKVTPWAGSSEGCPVGPVPPDGQCETAGLSCAYVYESESGASEYQECACVKRLEAESLWQCVTGASDRLDSCPNQVPEHGSDCYGYFDVVCWYPPQLECSCFSAEGTWDCPSPDSDSVLEPPSSVNPESAVAELSDQEREAWCDWFSTVAAGGPGHAPIADRPVDENGYATGAACHYSLQFCQAAVPALSKAQCLGNLSLSDCTAPIKHLTECVRLVHSASCGAADFSCLDYFETPNCSGTIALHSENVEPHGSACNIRVE